MANRALYTRVGILILAAIALAAGFVIFLTSGRLSGSARVLETYVSESVTGLEVGAPVRYRGVQVGSVTELSLVSAQYRRPDDAPFSQSFQLVLIRFAVDREKIGGESTPRVSEAIRLGLRARIAAQGITGVSYLELDFLDPERFPPLPIPWQPQYTYVPAAPSTVAQVRNAAEELVGRLARLPLESLMANLAGIAANLNEQSRNADLGGTLNEVRMLVAELRQTLAGSELPLMMQELRNLTGDVHNLLGGPETRQTVNNLSGAAAELRQALQRLPAAVQALEGTLRAARGTSNDAQAELVPILRDLRAAAGGLRDVTEQLRRAPSQTLFGAPPPRPPEQRN
jgi:ABC-type transporter Mla subunit MlaD